MGIRYSVGIRHALYDSVDHNKQEGLSDGGVAKINSEAEGEESR